MQTNTKTPQLKRVLSSSFAISAGVGGIIGLGRLRTPGEIVTVFPNPFVYVGLWLLGGLFVLSQDGLGADRATRIGDKGNPVFAVLLTWALGVILILMGGFEYLLNFNVLLFVFMAVSAPESTLGVATMVAISLPVHFSLKRYHAGKDDF